MVGIQLIRLETKYSELSVLGDMCRMHLSIVLTTHIKRKCWMYVKESKMNSYCLWLEKILYWGLFSSDVKKTLFNLWLFNVLLVFTIDECWSIDAYPKIGNGNLMCALWNFKQ